MEKMKNPLAQGPEQLDMDVMAEAELKRLQRQFRIMEGDRHAYTEESGVKLAKQRRVISALTKEKNTLSGDYKVILRDANKKSDESKVAAVNALLDQQERARNQIKKNKAAIDEIDYQIIKVEKQVSYLRTKQSTEGQYVEAIRTSKKRLKTLENKLENVVKRFCGVLGENKRLREEIDHLLKERTQFNSQWRRLISELNLGKKVMLELIEQATTAYDQREEWCAKFQALKNRALNDLVIHTQEIKELQRQLNIDENLQVFLGIKGRIRILKDLEEREARRREEERLNQELQLMEYQNTLQSIKDLMEEEDVDKLEAIFVKQEEENFALFNYVNELNHEMETVGGNIEQLQAEIDEQTRLKDTREKHQMNKLQVLEEQLEAAQREANEVEVRHEKTESDLNSLLSGIADVFRTVNYEESPMMNLLGDNSKISLHNVNMYLGLIEKNVNELIKKGCFSDKVQFSTE